MTRTVLEPSSNGRAITTHQASVKTATVEVKTLTITGKQVTLTVFRQLQEEPLIDPETCELRGEPWGIVNYHPDKACSDMSHHVHVVWQKGTELRRACVTEGWRNQRLFAYRIDHAERQQSLKVDRAEKLCTDAAELVVTRRILSDVPSGLEQMTVDLCSKFLFSHQHLKVRSGESSSGLCSYKYEAPWNIWRKGPESYEMTCRVNDNGGSRPATAEEIEQRKAEWRKHAWQALKDRDAELVTELSEVVEEFFNGQTMGEVLEVREASHPDFVRAAELCHMWAIELWHRVKGGSSSYQRCPGTPRPHEGAIHRAVRIPRRPRAALHRGVGEVPPAMKRSPARRLSPAQRAAVALPESGPTSPLVRRIQASAGT